MLILATSGAILRMLDTLIDDDSSSSNHQTISRMVLFSLFVVENAFVQLLYTQHWSFLSSTTPSASQGAVWFAPIAGLGSLASTLSALSIVYIVPHLGIPNLLLLASIVMSGALFASDAAYRVAEKVRPRFAMDA